MSRNSFGTLFRFTTFGESHGAGIGVVIDGCPAGLALNLSEIQDSLNKRRPGFHPSVSPRKESDECEILSGVFQGQTTGAPLALFIRNRDAQSDKYDALKNVYRPGHANFSYLEKYGVFDHRGGGRASGRETAARVVAGNVAKQLLEIHGIQVNAYLKAIGHVQIPDDAPLSYDLHQENLFCPHEPTAQAMQLLIEEVKQEGDSLGGVVEVVCHNIPPGWGDPVYEKLEAKLAAAMLSIPASKGFEIGEGFAASKMKGSLHNDSFAFSGKSVVTATNRAGGTLGGISTGMPLVFRVPFKPTSSIAKVQKTLDRDGKKTEMRLPAGSRHDPCISIRAVPVVEAMTYVVLADAMLLSRCSKISYDVG